MDEYKRKSSILEAFAVQKLKICMYIAYYRPYIDIKYIFKNTRLVLEIRKWWKSFNIKSRFHTV